MDRVNFADFGSDVRKAITRACDYLREHPDTELFIPEGEYVLEDKRAKKVMDDCLSGAYGENPQDVVYTSDFRYSKGFDLNGCKNITINAYNVKLKVNGFMEPISIKNAKNITVKGLSIDLVRKPFSRGRIVRFDDDFVDIRIDEDMPVDENTPTMRNFTYDTEYDCLGQCFFDFHKGKTLGNNLFRFDRTDFCETGDLTRFEVYLTHSFHFRPSILISHSKNVLLEDVTIYTQSGMGIVGFKSENIEINRLHIVPSDDYKMSTSTDATHFACCKGYVKVLNSEFRGHGDDAINIHNYYYKIKSVNGNKCQISILYPCGTHCQEPDYPLPDFTLQLLRKDTLEPVEDFRVVASSETEDCDVLLDKALCIENPEDYLFGNMTEIPSLEFCGNRVEKHLARSVLCKTHNALIENNMFAGNSGTAIEVAAEGSWGEGIASENVKIIGNTFIGNGVNWHGRVLKTGAICVTIDSFKPSVSGLHKNIIIKDNKMDAFEGVERAITVLNAQNVRIENNEITGFKTNIFTDFCEDLTIVK